VHHSNEQGPVRRRPCGAFIDAIGAQPDHWQAFQYLGTAYAAQGMVNEAAGAYERMLRTEPRCGTQSLVDQWKVQSGVAA